MNYLTLILLIKIVITLFVLVLPLLFLSEQRLAKILKMPEGAGQLMRLYGIALVALLVNYCLGLHDSIHNQFPHHVVVTGIVSNLGAGMYLLWVKQRLASAVFSAIGIALLASYIWPAQFL